MRNTLILAALLAAAPFAASAEGMSYTYVEAGYANLKSDGVDAMSGAYARGSFAIAPQVFVFGSYSRVSDTQRFDLGFPGDEDELRLKYTITQPEIGIGYHMEFTEKLDFVADAAYQQLEVKAKVSSSTSSDSDKATVDVARITAGVRGKPSPRTEAWLKAGYFHFNGGGQNEGKAAGIAGLQVNLTPMWGIVGEMQFYDSNRQGTIGVRASF
ncbi:MULTISPECIES: outer membrane beta-barrel protein [Xanthomonas]|uniref:Outer membrane beta-barrel protein n=1 Tax=Xanthomonas manihotis TaxID=43353 RepID=A0A8I1XJD8_XANMN|nr:MULTISPECIES: outer membrane beta-barrel protein [Xanthomonas]KUF28643.1 hypothetical protein AO826_06370 [Xanthomonas phaseoli pv. manihotis]MBO9721294.1 outer membrane beta-barrel protein [Xanthomonas phaseoli pv. manihotis]MBO9754358.1 outer membrane beta-barrel protein [Xanthomonas phaseoli pv. manihotis]MBO9760354.1 outer membrane beta-barrel protein [Xanthomonas phaseoli pv. manihotis]MBO9762423.1 outer membrane beta-barrel protein [Xanthomonas phaseoli pv. manihotis]